MSRFAAHCFNVAGFYTNVSYLTFPLTYTHTHIYVSGERGGLMWVSLGGRGRNARTHARTRAQRLTINFTACAPHAF